MQKTFKQIRNEYDCGKSFSETTNQNRSTQSINLKNKHDNNVVHVTKIVLTSLNLTFSEKLVNLNQKIETLSNNGHTLFVITKNVT